MAKDPRIEEPETSGETTPPGVDEIVPHWMSQFAGEVGSSGETVLEATVQEDDDPLSGVGFGPLFIEKLLLGIIQANKVGGQTDQTRLAKAMKALLGKQPLKTVFQGRRDQALIWMASERIKDLRGAARKRTNRKLAAEAAALFFPRNEQQRAKDLYELFSGYYQRKLQGFREEVDYTKTYMYRAEQHDYVVESLEAQSLVKIRSELAKWQIDMNVVDS